MERKNIIEFSLTLKEIIGLIKERVLVAILAAKNTETTESSEKNNLSEDEDIDLSPILIWNQNIGLIIKFVFTEKVLEKGIKVEDSYQVTIEKESILESVRQHCIETEKLEKSATIDWIIKNATWNTNIQICAKDIFLTFSLIQQVVSPTTEDPK